MIKPPHIEQSKSRLIKASMNKMRLRKWILLLCLMAIVPALARTSPQTKQSMELQQKAAQFRAYRIGLRQDEERKRPELRNWNGPVHNIFSDVERLIEAGRYTSREVVELLGEPDWTFKTGSHQGIRVARGETHLAYWWRGGHDYIYFIIRRGRVARSSWWHAGE